MPPPRSCGEVRCDGSGRDRAAESCIACASRGNISPGTVCRAQHGRAATTVVRHADERSHRATVASIAGTARGSGDAGTIAVGWTPNGHTAAGVERSSGRCNDGALKASRTGTALHHAEAVAVGRARGCPARAEVIRSHSNGRHRSTEPCIAVAANRNVAPRAVGRARHRHTAARVVGRPNGRHDRAAITGVARAAHRDALAIAVCRAGSGRARGSVEWRCIGGDDRALKARSTRASRGHTAARGTGRASHDWKNKCLCKIKILSSREYMPQVT